MYGPPPTLATFSMHLALSLAARVECVFVYACWVVPCSECSINVCLEICLHQIFVPFSQIKLGSSFTFCGEQSKGTAWHLEAP